MAIYTDGVHLVADRLSELHDFAKYMCFPKSWFQNKKREHLHYDLTTNRAAIRAVEYGAMKVSPKELLIIMKNMKGD